ncbi:hypothetical protein KOR34_19570 [Posidoniimonas corsicana]|uniref:Uncharacterized protein n=1 Tax=Posidoniimonas corsicana TaxID=1938618 RepID=A0A5C5VFY6_9BACT|nr:hypothetical protein [Posidoniimonas corsicana]TWT37011.1 hypothetical protein KOR34_19570 [Posidoniimonas corsicana]
MALSDKIRFAAEPEGEPADIVLGTLEKLQQILQPDGPAPFSTTAATPFMGAWRTLECALVNVRGEIHSPPPGRGLQSLWLWVVAQRAKAVQEAANRSGGVADRLLHDDENLRWLISNGWHLGVQVRGWAARRGPDLGSVLEPDSNAATRLWALVNEYASLSEDGAPNAKEAGELLRQAGRLVLECVEQGEVPDWLTEDPALCERFLSDLDSPERFLRSVLPAEFTANDLRSLVNHVAPRDSSEQTEETPNTGSTADVLSGNGSSPPRSARETLVAKFAQFADKLASSRAKWMDGSMDYSIGTAIHSAWLHDLLVNEPAVHRAVGWVVENPPPAEAAKQHRSSYSRTGLRYPRSQQEMMKEAVYLEVFNLMHSTGQIEEGRAGGEQMCRRLAKIVEGDNQIATRTPEGEVQSPQVHTQTLSWLLSQLQGYELYDRLAKEQFAKIKRAPALGSVEAHYDSVGRERRQSANQFLRDISECPGSDRLRAYCDANNVEWSKRGIEHLRGKLCESLDCAPAEINRLSLVAFRERLREVVNGVASDVSSGSSGATPAEADAQEAGGDENRYSRLEDLVPAHRKAYYSFLYAEAKSERRLEDRDAYNWLKENGVDDAERSELQDYELPAFDTWSRYLRFARKALDERKYTPRSGRRQSG